MRKLIEVSKEALETIMNGRYVEGTIRMVAGRGLVFTKWNRKSCNQQADRILYRSANGWLKESTQRLKMWVSVPRDLGACRCADVLQRECGEMADYLAENADFLEGDIIQFL